MMCEPDERDLAHAADAAIAKARAAGLAGDALVEDATDAVAAVWAHLDRAVVRAAVLRQLAGGAAPGSG